MKIDLRSNIQAIFWDFDGVIMDSNGIRDLGFAEVLKSYPVAELERLLYYHRQNGGLSRYVKFRYFFESIRGEPISEERIRLLAAEFSAIMRQLLLDPGLLIAETLDLIKRNYQRLPMHIVSGSDQAELRYICQILNIAHYFKSIHGSPTPKSRLVYRVLAKKEYERKYCILIGDSVNDREAALQNGIHFIGYNNIALEKESSITLEEIFP